VYLIVEKWSEIVYVPCADPLLLLESLP
jgi:hypothetical protein